MSQRFVRCPHCGTPHDAQAAVCPTTGKRMRIEGPRPSEPARKGRSSPPNHGFTSSAPGALEPLGFDDPSLIGQVLGNRYRVISVLGSGGMGVVYEAEHLGLERAVAVKVLNPLQAKKKNTVKRFQQEARAAGGIGHPNICEVYDMGWLEDGCPYLVMERLHGQTLADRVRKSGGLPFLEAIDVLTQVLAGLMAAHEKGIMHRDIKPENIFLSRRTNADPVAKILDFGVSKGMAGGAEEPLDLTRTGMVMGTPYYMSPEQARGERSLDARVDVYACGVMLYECLTGRRPFLAPNYNALLLQILTENPRSARDLRPDLPAPFEAILRRAMARSRDDRYPTAGALRRDLLHMGKQLGQSPERELAGGQRVDRAPDALRQHGAPSPSPVAAGYTRPSPLAPPPIPAAPASAPGVYPPSAPSAHAHHPWASSPGGPASKAQAPQVPAAARSVVQAIRPAAGALAHTPGLAPLHAPGPTVHAPTSAKDAPTPVRRQTARMAPPLHPTAPAPHPPSHAEKLRAPLAGANVPRSADTDNLPKLFDTSPSSDVTPSHHVRPHPVPALRRPSHDAAFSKQSHAALPRPQPPAVARKTEPQDFSDAPTYVISREEILGDFVSNPRPPARPIVAKPTEISDWDAETTVTTAPPEWESDTSDDGPSPHLVATPVESERSPAPAPDRVDSLRRRLEEEYGDLPVDDATLVHRARPPRRK